MRLNSFICLAVIVAGLATSEPCCQTESLVSEGLGLNAYSASATYQSFTPDLAFDGDLQTTWNSDQFTGWIEVDLGEIYELSRIEMTLNVSPAGTATHQVWTSVEPMQEVTSGGRLAHEFSGPVSDRDVLAHGFDVLTQARFVQVRTVSSPGWAAWWEIQVFAVCTDEDADQFPREPGCDAAIDCNDADDSINSAATELCNGYDDDCDGSLDEGCDGQCEDPEAAGSAIRVSDLPAVSQVPSLVWTGTEFGLAWEDEQDGTLEIFFTRLSAQGDQLSPNTRMSDLGDHSRFPSLAWTGNSYGVAWYDYRHTTQEIYFTRIDATGNKIGSDLLISDLAIGDDALGPVLVWNGREFGVAWGETVPPLGHRRAYFVRIDPAGNKIGTEALVGGGSDASAPSLAWAETEFGLAWGSGELYFTRIDATGLEIGSDILISASGSGDPSLVWTGAEYGLAWHEHEKILFVRLDEFGNTIGDTVQISAETDSFKPSLAWTGSEYGISWYSNRSGNFEIYFTRISATGEKIGNDLRLTNDSAESWEQALTWTGKEFGIAWQDERDGDFEIYFNRIFCCDDLDGDSYTECRDCNDADDEVYPGAVQLCDGKNNDCDDPSWPALPANEVDQDGDSFSPCAGDCDESDSSRNPNASEICNGIDDNCNGLVDDDVLGEDSDGDGFNNVCDNCPSAFNSDQFDTDGDGYGNACDNCIQLPNDQTDTDSDTVGDMCDNCPESVNVNQANSDGDSHGDVCDNCINTANESQHDLDLDQEGDECDLDDGVVIFRTISDPRVRWQGDPLYSAYHLYRGSLAVLLAGGPYAQEPGSNPYADRFCDLTLTRFDDTAVPFPSQALYWLVTGKGVAGEEPLGDGTGVTRPNDNPCP